MLPSKRANKEHWDAVGSAYSKVWSSAGKTMLSKKELTYIASDIEQYSPKTVLDIGCGTGRILQEYTFHESVERIYALDISDAMIAHCKERFRAEKKIAEIICGDIEHESVFPIEKFDMISAIRVLKYNPSWRDMLKAMAHKLSPSGILVCTMPNSQSITSVWPDNLASVTPDGFRKAIEQAGLRVIDMRGFSKLPDKMHSWARNPALAAMLHTTEDALAAMLGPIMGTRILFATCRLASDAEHPSEERRVYRSKKG